MVSKTNQITKGGRKNERYNDLKTLSEIIENLYSSKNYNSCNTTTTNSNGNDDSEIPNSNNAPLAPSKWDILSTTSDTTTNCDSGRSINAMLSTSAEGQ